jgi:hypothetical protein
MAVIKSSIEGMRVEIGQIFSGKFYQSLCQIERSSRELTGKCIRLPFMLAGEKTQSWCQGKQ